MEFLHAHVDDVGRSLAEDEEFELYTRPRFIDELVLLPFGRDGVLVYGGAESEVLRGASSLATLDTLLPLLDGTKSIQELAAMMPELGGARLSSIVALLQSRGLIEDGEPQDVDASRAELAAFLGRFNDVTRLNRNRYEALDRLAKSRVSVVASGETRDWLCSQFQAAGVGAVGVGPDWEADVTVVVPTDEDEDELADVMTDGAMRHGRSIFWLRMGREHIRLGPLYLPGSSPCYPCVRRAHTVQGLGRMPDDLFWASLGGVVVFHVLSRLGGPKMFGYNGYQLLGRDSTMPARLYILGRRPGCPGCGLEGAPSAWVDQPAAALAWAYQAAVSFPPFEFVSRRDYQVHYSGLNRELTRSTEPGLPGLRSVDLPPRSAAAIPRARSEVVSMDAVAHVLRESAGLNDRRNGGPWRLAPSSGSLGSVELFAAASNVAGLPDGVYGYDMTTDRLLLHYEGRTELVDSIDGSACLIVGLGAFGRLQEKYGNLAYRLVYLDGGVSLAYVYEASAEVGLSVLELPIVDDAIEDLIGLPSRAGRFIPVFVAGLVNRSSIHTRP